MQHWDLRQIEAPGGTRSPSVLLSEDEARAVLIVLHAGQSLGDHQVKEHAWIVVVDGEAELSFGSETVSASVGTLVHFEPDERHSVSSAGGARLLLLLAPWPGVGHYRGGQGAAG